MILPLGDAPNPRGTPLVTYALIAANCLVYALITLPLSAARPDPRDPLFAQYVRTVIEVMPPGTSLRQIVQQTTAYDLFVFAHGYRPAAPDALSLFTAMFLHGGFLHLAGNMLFLWIYGDNVEHRLGRLPFLFWYLATGVAATLAHAAFDADSPLPLVGASGAISGVLGFYFLWFPHNTVRLWVFFFPLFMNIVEVPARLVLGMYLIVENMLPFLATRGIEGGGVAYGAHIGGFIAGLAAAWVMGRRDVVGTPREFRAPRRAAVPTPAEEIADALAAGDGETAARIYFALPADATRRALDPKTSLELARWLAEHGHGQAALVVYQRHLRDYPIGRGAAEAHLGAGLVLLHLLGQPAAAYQHLVEALELDPDPITEERAREALAYIATLQKRNLARFRTR